jgi:putative sterol carrier protein
MSDLTRMQASDILNDVSTAFEKLSEDEKKAQIKKVCSLACITAAWIHGLILDCQTNGIFQLNVKNADGKEGVWTIDMKKTGTVYKGDAKPKADVTIILSDDTFSQLAAGKLDGQKAFMTGKLKTKGNVMLATKLDGVLKVRFYPALLF